VAEPLLLVQAKRPDFGRGAFLGRQKKFVGNARLWKGAHRVVEGYLRCFLRSWKPNARLVITDP